MRRGRPEVLAGGDLQRREVRWVHTSEIYEIAPLLKGGEVLLTTGLGLVGMSPAALRDYATGLGQRSIAALVLELGRTFTSAPPALVSAARDANLPLVTLRGIVPFVEVTEEVHALLLSEEIGRLRLAEQIQAAIVPALLAGAGLLAVLRVLADLAGCPVRLYAEDGHLVAASDRERGSSRGETGASDADGDSPSGAPRVPVELFGRAWGQLLVAGAPNGVRATVAERGAVAVALELGRTGASAAGFGRRRAGALLVREIFGRQYSSADELAGRAAALGVVIRPGQRAVAICLAVDPVGPSKLPPRVDARTGVRRALPTADASTGPARNPFRPDRKSGRAAGPTGHPTILADQAGHPTIAIASTAPQPEREGAVPREGRSGGAAAQATMTAVTTAAEAQFGTALVAELDGSYLVVAATDADDLRALVARLADRVDAALPSGRAVAVTCGPVVAEFAALSGSLRTAREASLLARRLRSGMRGLLASDLGVHRLLSRFTADPELATFVAEQLGPLLDYDAAHGRELVRTLDTLLACGLSKAAAARVLGVRRQTLYQRLDTMSALLGGLDLTSRERRTAIDLALVGWRLRAAAVQPTRTLEGPAEPDRMG